MSKNVFQEGRLVIEKHKNDSFSLSSTGRPDRMETGDYFCFTDIHDLFTFLGAQMEEFKRITK